MGTRAIGRVPWIAAGACAAVLACAGVARGQDIWDDFDNPYAGQPRSLSLSAFGGAYWSTPWSDLVVLGTATGRSTIEQVLLRQVQVGPAKMVGGSVTYRRGRGGARLQLAYSRSCLEIAGSCDPASQGSATQIPLPRRIEVNTWIADIDAEVGLLPVSSNVRWARPYLLVGGGGVVYDPQGSAAQLLPQFLEFPGGTARTDGSDVIVQFPGSSQIIVGVRGAGLQTVFSGVLGLGTDLRLPLGNGGIGLRLEAADHIVESPMRVSVLNAAGLPSQMTFGAIHNLRFTAGATVDFDLGRVKRKVAGIDR